MSKKGNIFYGLKQNLEKNKKYGKSKEAEKKIARQKAKETGKYVQPTGLRSGETVKTYSKQVEVFAKWAAKNTTAKNAIQAKKFVGKYLQGMNDGTILTKHGKKYSAWSINTSASALASAYNCSRNDFAVDLPSRVRDDIKRSRNGNGSKSVNRFQSEANDRIRKFSAATGARREGIINLTIKDVREKNGKVEVFLSEKNGIRRWAQVAKGKEDFVKSCFQNFTQGFGKLKDRIFDRKDIPSEIHSQRHNYAKTMYRDKDFFDSHKNGILYHCRGSFVGVSFDKGVLRAISEQMGHHRIDVVVGYLVSDTL